MRKQLSFVLLTLCMALVLLPGTAQAEEESQNSFTGTYGGLTWKYEQILDDSGAPRADGILTISGSGAMLDADYTDLSRAPWHIYGDYISTVIIERGITSIGDVAFDEFKHLTNVTIPDSVTSIGAYAFSGCSSLSDVAIPNDVKYIGSGAFSRCSALSEISIPASVISLGNNYNTFDGCLNLTEIMVDPQNKEYSSQGGALFTKEKNTILYCPEGITAFTIPDGVRTIASTAFRDNTKLASITVSNSVETIESYAFSGCTELTAITIPDSVKSIEASVFRGCTKLTTITIPDSTSVSGWYTFADCTSLSDINWPKGMFGTYYTFSGCTSLNSITIPVGVGTLDKTFYGCTNLKMVHLPFSLISISSETFYKCPLKSIEYSGNEAQWGAIEIENGNAEIGLAEITFLNLFDPSATPPTLNVPTDSESLKALANQMELLKYVDFDVLDDTYVTKLELVELIAALPGFKMDNFDDNSTFPYPDCDDLTTIQKAIILSAGNYGITGGYADNTYSPNQLITRGQAVIFLYRFLDEPITWMNPEFLDVLSSNVFYPAIVSLYSAGIIKPSEYFYPSDPATRLAVVEWLCGAVLYMKGESLPDIPGTPDTPDAPNTPDVLSLTVTNGGLGKRVAVTIESGHWLTIQTRRSGSISITSIRAPGSGKVTLTFSSATGSSIQVWETAEEMRFVNGVPTNRILATASRSL